MRQIQPIENYIQYLQTRKKKVIIRRRSRNCLAFLSTKNLRRVIAHYNKEARRIFKDPEVEIKIFHLKLGTTKLRLKFKKNKGLIHIKARFRNRFFFL